MLHVAGEVDLLSLPVLQDALTAALTRRPGDLVVDLAAVTFCGVRAFALLAATADTAHANETRYAVSGLNPNLDRIATLLWPENPYMRYRSAAAAVIAIRIDQAYQPT